MPPGPERRSEGTLSASASEAASEQDSTSNFEQMLLENLQKAGVQNGRKAERFEFAEIERVPGKHLTARAIPSGHKPQGDDAFAVQAEHQAGTIRILLVRMNAHLAMGESLLKKTKAANLFTAFGEPDIAPPQWTDDGWVVTIRGFDVYNPITGEVRAGDEQDIAMWMIDTEYNEESFFVRHAYFLGANPYERLKKELKADIDADAWDSLNSATSRPFAHPATGKIAVKVINHCGDELLTVLDLPDPGAM